MTRAHVAVGSNIEPRRHVPSGLTRLHDLAPIVAASPFYVTRPILRDDQAPFWNGIVVVETGSERAPLSAALRRIEDAEGRVRTADRHAARTLDLDLLLWDGAPTDDDARDEVLARPWLARCLVDLDPSFVLVGDTAPLRIRLRGAPDHERALWAWEPPG